MKTIGKGNQKFKSGKVWNSDLNMSLSLAINKKEYP